jgi:dihydroneopterin aldolase
VVDPMKRGGRIQPISVAATRTVRRMLFVRDLVVPCAIGVYAHEKGKRQNVRINVELNIAEPDAEHHDRITEVVSYDDVVTGIRALADQGHIHLVETLAERIADLCLADRRVNRVRVRIEKLDVLPEAESVGVEIDRQYAE